MVKDGAGADRLVWLKVRLFAVHVQAATMTHWVVARKSGRYESATHPLSSSTKGEPCLFYNPVWSVRLASECDQGD